MTQILLLRSMRIMAIESTSHTRPLPSNLCMHLGIISLLTRTRNVFDTAAADTRILSTGINICSAVPTTFAFHVLCRHDLQRQSGNLSDDSVKWCITVRQYACTRSDEHKT